MKLSRIVKIVSKVMLLLIIIGFFQPVACNQKGFDLAETCWKMDAGSSRTVAVCLYAIFFIAAFSIAYTVGLLCTKKDLCAKSANLMDNFCIILMFIAAVISFVILQDQFSTKVFNSGAWLIFWGWLLSLIALDTSVILNIKNK